MYIIVVQSLSCVQLFVTPWSAACQASLSLTISWSLLRLTSIELVMPSNHLIILCRPRLLPPSIFPSIRVFSSESVPIRWPEYWCFSFRLFATPWIVACQDSPGKNTGVGCHALQGILAPQGSNPVLLHCGWILYVWATKEALGG